MKTLKPLWSPLATPMTACWYTRDCFADEITGKVVQGFNGKFYPCLDGKTFQRQPVKVRYISLDNGKTTVYLCDSAGGRYTIPRVDIH